MRGLFLVISIALSCVACSHTMHIGKESPSEVMDSSIQVYDRVPSDFVEIDFSEAVSIDHDIDTNDVVLNMELKRRGIPLLFQITHDKDIPTCLDIVYFYYTPTDTIGFSWFMVGMPVGAAVIRTAISKVEWMFVLQGHENSDKLYAVNTQTNMIYESNWFNTTMEYYNLYLNSTSTDSPEVIVLYSESETKERLQFKPASTKPRSALAPERLKFVWSMEEIDELKQKGINFEDQDWTIPE